MVVVFNQPACILFQPQRPQPRDAEFEVVFTLKNPLPVTLTECEWEVKGPGYHKIPKIKQK